MKFIATSILLASSAFAIHMKALNGPGDPDYQEPSSMEDCDDWSPPGPGCDYDDPAHYHGGCYDSEGNWCLEDALWERDMPAMADREAGMFDWHCIDGGIVRDRVQNMLNLMDVNDNGVEEWEWGWYIDTYCYYEDCPEEFLAVADHIWEICPPNPNADDVVNAMLAEPEGPDIYQIYDFTIRAANAFAHVVTQTAFEFLDISGDGFVTQTELVEAVVEMALMVDEDHKNEIMYIIVDEMSEDDKDAIIEPFLREHLPGVVQEACDAIDANDDDQITQDELYAAVNMILDIPDMRRDILEGLTVAGDWMINAGVMGDVLPVEPVDTPDSMGSSGD